MEFRRLLFRSAAESRLLDSDGTSVALIRRFDRSAEGGRLLYISAATMIGADADDATAPTYTELVDALRQEIGRAWWRGRGCREELIRVGGESDKHKPKELAIIVKSNAKT